jgi:hypothetical protein
VRTVKAHRAQAMSKMGVRSIADLISAAARLAALQAGEGRHPLPAAVQPL